MEEIQNNLASVIYLRSRFVTKELCAALEHHCIKECSDALPYLVKGNAARLLRPELMIPVDNHLATVAQLVCPETAPQFRSLDPPSRQGQEAVLKLRQFVYPTSVGFEESLHMDLLQGSIAQARLLQDLLTATLIDSVSTSTCFSLFRVADSINCNDLRQAAELCCLQHFATAVDEDSEGFDNLNVAQVAHILGNDALVSPSEIEVFNAICKWVEYDFNDRKAQMASLMAHCIRFNDLGLDDLRAIDDHQIVRSDRGSGNISAYALLNCIMCKPFNKAFGHHINEAPRLRPYPDYGASFEASDMFTGRLATLLGFQHGNEFLLSPGKALRENRPSPCAIAGEQAMPARRVLFC